MYSYSIFGCGRRSLECTAVFYTFLKSFLLLEAMSGFSLCFRLLCQFSIKNSIALKFFIGN